MFDAKSGANVVLVRTDDGLDPGEIVGGTFPLRSCARGTRVVHARGPVVVGGRGGEGGGMGGRRAVFQRKKKKKTPMKGQEGAKK